MYPEGYHTEGTYTCQDFPTKSFSLDHVLEFDALFWKKSASIAHYGEIIMVSFDPALEISSWNYILRRRIIQWIADIQKWQDY